MSAPRQKVLMLTTQLGYGGAETSFIRLANFLSQTMDVTVALFTSDYGTASYAKGHEQLTAPVTLLDDTTQRHRLARWWQRIRRLRRLKAEHSATISFLSGPNLVNVLAGYNQRSIVSVRGSRFYDPVAPRLQQWVFRHILDPITYRLAAHIVPVSPGLTHEILKVAGTSAAQKITTIPPFIDPENIARRMAEPVPETYAMLHGQKVIVAVGRLSIEKGFHHLLRIVHSLGKHQSGIKLLLIGDGPMLQQLQRYCHDHHLPMNDTTPGITSVIFAGYQQNPLPFLTLARLYALTSATEGFPNVLLEAMSAGLPVIAADTPWGARAILSDEKPSATPYPTLCATPTPYGTLMPRIDLPEYETLWVETLSTALEKPAIPPQAATRAAEHNLTAIGARWQSLLATQQPALPIIYAVDASIATTGAFIALRNTARALQGQARIVLVLPKRSTIKAEALTDFWRVEYLPLVTLARNWRALLAYIPALLHDSWQLKRRMARSNATRLVLNDFYLMHGAVLRLLAAKTHIVTWVRCNPSHIAGPLARPLLFLARQSTNHLVAVSDYVASLLPPRPAPTRIYDYYRNTPHTRRTWQSTDEKIFVYVGNYIAGKGQDIAIRAFANAAAKNLTLMLHFYGSDMGLQKNRDYRAMLTTMLQQHRLTDRVTLHDAITDTAPVLAGAFAALNFSTSESFSMTVLEASGAGLPVIATASGGPQEIIRDGITGHLIAINDIEAATNHILALADQPARAAAMGEAGAHHIQTYFCEPIFRNHLHTVLALP